MQKIVFACVHNAGRSQMAAAWFNHLRNLQPSNSRPHTSDSREAGSEPVVAISAGTSPGDRVHPEVVEVMREAGLDLSTARPQQLTRELLEGATLLVTMGCGDKCPYVPGLKVEDWPLEDPKGKPIERVRQIRDEIKQRVEELVRRS